MEDLETKEVIELLEKLSEERFDEILEVDVSRDDKPYLKKNKRYCQEE